MKKNKMMRAALALLVVTMLTMSIVSGTFAKYVTQGSATDSARVAKFGVEVKSTGSLFSKTYAKGDNTPGGETLSVESEEKVVAPGTKNDTGLTLSLTGKPEVDVKVTFNVTNATEIHLGDYYPVKFTLKKGNTAIVENDTLAKVKEELNKLEVSYTAGTELSSGETINLSWKWDFAGDDTKDTKLGDIAAGKATAGDNDSINTAFAATVTVTQVD